jgi:hypothetical protein
METSSRLFAISIFLAYASLSVGASSCATVTNGNQLVTGLIMMSDSKTCDVSLGSKKSIPCAVSKNDSGVTVLNINTQSLEWREQPVCNVHGELISNKRYQRYQVFVTNCSTNQIRVDLPGIEKEIYEGKVIATLMGR